jgi:hypothetical protein
LCETIRRLTPGVYGMQTLWYIQYILHFFILAIIYHSALISPFELHYVKILSHIPRISVY